MNKLEDQNLHEFRIRKTILILVLRGGIAWLSFAALSYGFDWLTRFVQTAAPSTLLQLPINSERILSSSAAFHLSLNFLYGWLLLYIVLAWIYDYFLIKPDTLIVRKGIFFSDETAYQMEDIKSVEVLQGFIGKIVNTGTLRLHAFRAQKEILLPDVRDPHTVAAHIQTLIPKPDAGLTHTYSY